MKKIALYARVSTDNGHQDPDLQLMPMREDSQRRSLEIVEEYVDYISGKEKKRPALDRLMSDARAHRFEAVMVWKWDRFARGSLHLAQALETFNLLGIRFVSLTEGTDTDTPAGKMLFTILGAVAEMERSLIVERVKAGLRNARAKGKRIGGTQIPGPGKVLGRPSGAADLKPRKRKHHLDLAQIYRLSRADWSYRAIAEKLGVSPMTICNALKNDKKNNPIA